MSARAASAPATPRSDAPSRRREGPRPARRAGGRCGRCASARAIASRRSWPSGSTAAGADVRSASATISSASRASRLMRCSSRHCQGGRSMLSTNPDRDGRARPTAALSRTSSCSSGRVVWKTVARPLRARRCGGQRVTSSRRPRPGRSRRGGTRDAAEQRRLAGAVRADQAGERALGDRERDVVDGLDGAERLRYAGQLAGVRASGNGRHGSVVHGKLGHASRLAHLSNLVSDVELSVAGERAGQPRPRLAPTSSSS